jgi:xanthine/uracil permease
MMKWEGYLVVGIIVLIIGAMLIAWASNMYFPTAYRTFLGIPYHVSPEYLDAFRQYMGLLMFGFMFSGFGLAVICCTATIYQLEKKLMRVQPPPPK